MANILRPPIVFNAPRKYQLGTPDPPQRPLTIIPQPAGITLPYQAVRIDYSAPQRKYQPIVDVYPNLSATTLKPAASAYALPLSAERIDWTPQLRKFEVQADNYRAPITLGINPNAGVIDWSESAPRYPHTPKVDVYPNLSETTLAPVAGLNLPLRAVRLDQSAPPSKHQIIAEQYINPVILRPVPKMLQWNDSAPITKYQVIAEQYVNPVALRPIPKILGNTDSAPPPKKSVYADFFPNLSVTTLANYIAVPDVVGETQAQAIIDLSSFTVHVTTAYSDSVAAGLVISQLPVGGSLAIPGSIVIITVSLGPSSNGYVGFLVNIGSLMRH